MSDRTTVALGDICSIFTGKKDVNQTDESGKYTFFSCSPKTFRSNDYLFDGEAIIVAGNGSYTGRIAFFDGKFDLYQRTYACTLRDSPTSVNLKYIYYYMKVGFEPKFMGGTRGSSIPYIVRGDLADFTINLPPYPEQNAIADILGTLDDKIELNRKMNETLEETAREIFKSWFVDFDPVVAKSEGRQPEGMDVETAKLFPDSFVDSVIGRIPKGWEVLSFSKTIDIISGGTPKTTVDEFWGGDIPWFSVVDSPNESDIFVVATEKTITQAGVNASATHVLPIGTTIISARGTVGKVCIAGVPTAMNQSCYGLRGRLDSKGSYTYFSTRFLASTLQNHSHGSVFATITRSTFEGVSVVVPPRKIVEAFENQAEPFLEQIRNHLLQRQLLVSIRDTLLPRLLSGEMPVL